MNIKYFKTFVKHHKDFYFWGENFETWHILGKVLWIYICIIIYWNIFWSKLIIFNFKMEIFKIFQIKWSPKKTSLTPIRIFGPQPNIILQKFTQMLKTIVEITTLTKVLVFEFFQKSLKKNLKKKKKKGFELGLLD